MSLPPQSNRQPLLTAEALNARGKDLLDGLLGIEMLSVTRDILKAQLPIRKNLMAANGFLHAASLIALADTCCGYGTLDSLPEGALGFTTVELKSNFVGTVRDGVVVCEAKPLHRGRSTQIWDAQILNPELGKAIAHFRCTQLILWPKDC